MQQLTYVKKRALEWREAPEPTLRSPQEAIVRPFVAARCDADSGPLFYNVTTPLKVGLAIHYLDPLVRDMLGLVVGGAARSIGLYAAGIAVALGASRVDYLDSSRARLEIAQSLGANPIQIQGGAAWYRKHAPRRAGPGRI